MSREDLIIQLLAQLHDKQPANQPGKNDQLQKISVVSDVIGLADTQITATAITASAQRWGGPGYAPNWTWGAGEWR